MQFRTEIIFHTNDTRGQGRVYTDVGKDCLSWTTSKQYGTPAGTWNMMLSTRPDEDGLTWFQKLSAQDFVRIRLAIGDGPFVTVMNGLINRVFRQQTVQAGTGQINEIIQVTGLDIGKFLTKWQVYYNPYANAVEGLVKGLAIFDKILQGNQPKDALQALLDVMLFNPDTEAVKKIIALGEDRPLKVFIDPKNKDTPPAFELLQLHSTISRLIRTDAYNVISFEGVLWQAFKRWANEPWNELFVDNGHPGNAADPTLRTDDDVTFVHLREVPFSKDLFSKLITSDITYKDILGPFNASKGDDDTYTYYFANPIFYLPISALDAKAMGTFFLVDEDTVRSDGTPAIGLANRFGFRPMDLQSVHLSFGRSNDGDKKELEALQEDMFAEQKRLASLLLDFYDPNSEFLTSAIRIKPNRIARNEGGDPTLLKIGQRLRIKDNPKKRPNELYYISSVTNNWSFSNTFTQALQLTRGVEENRDV